MIVILAFLFPLIYPSFWIATNFAVSAVVGTEVSVGCAVSACGVSACGVVH
jgi:hypothetical protein